MQILDTGAGAADGLETYLARMLAERRQEEIEQSRREDDRLRRDTLTESSRYREAQQEANQIERDRIEAARQSVAADRNTDNLRAGLDDVLPGATFSPQRRDEIVNSGAALPERFSGGEVAFDEDFVGPLPSEAGMPGLERGERMDYTLNQSPNASTGQEPQSQQMEIELDGKRVPASYVPGRGGPGRIIYQGQDVTDRAKVYERPRATDERGWAPIIVQTPQGLVVTNQDRSGTKPLMGPDGQPLPLPPTTDDRNRSSAMRRVQPLLDAITELSPLINNKPGIEAVFAGGWRQVKAAANNDDDVAEYVAVIEAFTPLLARAEGHVGVLTEKDFEHAMAILPLPRDSASLALRKRARLEKILDAASSVGGGTPPAPSSGDIYDEYLRRSQPRP